MINSVGNYYRPVAYQAQTQTQPQAQPIFTGEEKKKEEMSKTSKTLLGLGALAAVCIGGLLLKRRIDLKSAQKAIIKTDDLTKEKFAELLGEQLKLSGGKLEEGSVLTCMNQAKMSKFVKEFPDDQLSKRISKILPGMSENGFVAEFSNNGNHVCEFFIDPKTISHENLLNAFAKNKAYINKNIVIK